MIDLERTCRTNLRALATGLARTTIDAERAAQARAVLMSNPLFGRQLIATQETVPSGGGQWGIQGPIALSTGAEVGVSPGKMIMAVAYGDQLTNLLQPFWALPLLAITGVRAREIVGYTCVLMLAMAVWLGFVLLVF